MALDITLQSAVALQNYLGSTFQDDAVDPNAVVEPAAAPGTAAEVINGLKAKGDSVKAPTTGISQTATDFFEYIKWGGIIFAVIAIAIVGIYIMFNVIGNNSANAAVNIKKVLTVLGGLIVIFNAPAIVGFAISLF